MTTNSQAVQPDAGRWLRKQYQDKFPGHHPSNLPSGTSGWQSAAVHGATLEWALQIVGLALRPEYRIGKLLRLATAVPVDVIDGLLADGWTTNELDDLIRWKGENLFPETVRRTRTLQQTALGASEPDSALLWCVLAAVLSADPVGLTDLQAFRWLRVVGPTDLEIQPGCPGWISRSVLAMSLAEEHAVVLQEWVPVAGPDGWTWAAAGYTPAETKMLLALPETHPDRPGPDQLAVMAALRQT